MLSCSTIAPHLLIKEKHNNLGKIMDNHTPEPEVFAAQSIQPEYSAQYNPN